MVHILGHGAGSRPLLHLLAAGISFPMGPAALPHRSTLAKMAAMDTEDSSAA